jgi:hypothetical protein
MTFVVDTFILNVIIDLSMFYSMVIHILELNIINNVLTFYSSHTDVFGFAETRFSLPVASLPFAITEL